MKNVLKLLEFSARVDVFHYYPPLNKKKLYLIQYQPPHRGRVSISWVLENICDTPKEPFNQKNLAT